MKPGQVGFRFHVMQPAKGGTSHFRASRNGGKHFVKPRRYPVYFVIGRGGHALYTCGVKASDETMAKAQAMIDEMRRQR